MIKCLHVVPYIGNESSGPAYSVPNLCRSLADHGTDVSLHTLDPVPERLLGFETIGYAHHRFPHPALGRSPQMLNGLSKACIHSDIIHNHSLWMLPNIYPEYARRGMACKLVVSPRGTLSAWALKRSRAKKIFSWLMGQRQALLKADMLHATSEKEYQEIRDFGLKQPVAVIPNGIDIPRVQRPPARHNMRQLLFLGRVHPVKGLENLINAWSGLEDAFTEWELIIAGPGKGGYLEKIRRLVTKLHLDRVRFKGELRGSEKQDALLGADLFVLPSHTENFGMVVAEALACCVPVITTRETPWRELDERKCGWCINTGKEPLMHCLRHVMSLSRDDLQEMGHNGRDWMRKDYSWNEIGLKMKIAYAWLLEKRERSDWILCD